MITNALSVQELVRIAAAGGGLDLDVRRLAVDDLVRIVVAASNKASRINLRNVAILSVDDMVRISVAGRGSVMFVD
jgi:hypothetical protein